MRLSLVLAAMLALASVMHPVPTLDAQGARGDRGLSSPPASRTALASGTSAIINVNVISMVSGASDTVRRQSAVVIRDGRIASVSPMGTFVAPRGATVVDGEGGYLFPGLADMHTHLWSDQHIPMSSGAAELGLFLANGITTARLLIGTPEHLALRAAVAKGTIVGPNLWTATPHLSGRPDTNARVVTTPDEGRAAVRAVGSAGFDFIKLTNFLTPDVYEAIMDEARRGGYRVDGHVNQGVSVERAATLGQHQQHLDGWMEALLHDSVTSRVSLTQFGVYDLKRWPSLDAIDDRKIAPLAGRVAKSGIWTTPTLALFNSVFADGETPDAARNRPDVPYVPARFAANVERSMSRYWSPASADVRTPARRQRFAEVRRRVVKALADSGAKLLVGSDAPDFTWAAGYSLHRELAALVEAGLSPYQVMAMATRSAADFLGASREWGTIEAGKRADLVLVGANPLENISHAAHIKGAAIGGRWLSRPALDSLLVKAREAINPGGR